MAWEQSASDSPSAIVKFGWSLVACKSQAALMLLSRRSDRTLASGPWYKHVVDTSLPGLDLAAVEVRLFTHAKNWFATGVSLRCVAVGIGLLAIVPKWAPAVPFIVAVVAIASEACAMRSDLVKSRADRLLRIREVHDGLGWSPDMTAIADVLAVTPESLEGVTSSVAVNTFGSQQPVGPSRAFENLKESAWWTQQLALLMFKGMAAVMIVLVVASFAFLVTSTVAAVSTPSRVAAARAVTALLAMVFSAGFVKLAFAYYLLHDRAKHTVARVKTMRESDDLTRRLIVLYEYQNARSSGPLIPDSVYARLRSRLNRLWQLQANP